MQGLHIAPHTETAELVEPKPQRKEGPAHQRVVVLPVPSVHGKRSRAFLQLDQKTVTSDLDQPQRTKGSWDGQ